MHGLTDATYNKTRARIEEMTDEDTRTQLLATLDATREVAQLFDLSHTRSPLELIEATERAHDLAVRNMLRLDGETGAQAP